MHSMPSQKWFHGNALEMKKSARKKIAKESRSKNKLIWSRVKQIKGLFTELIYARGFTEPVREHGLI